MSRAADPANPGLRAVDPLEGEAPDFDRLDLEALRARPTEKWATYRRPGLIAAWVAEMDFPLAAPIRAVLQRAVDANDVGYAVGLADTGLADAFAERMATRFDWHVEPARCEILSEVVQGLYVTLHAYSKPGEGAIVQTPIYAPFLASLRNTKRRLVENRLVRTPASWTIDFDALRSDTDASTRLLLLCNPHNPTGRVFTRDELEALAGVALERDLVVVTDEIHADLVYDGRPHIPFATLGPEVAARTVTITSASKAFNIPGLRCAVAHFGSRELQTRFNAAVSRHVRGGIGLLGIQATIAAWRDSQPWLDAAHAYLQANRDFVAAFLDERCPRIRSHPPEATYLTWLDCSELDLPTTPAQYFLEHANVALSDGHHFGEAFERFARLNFATSRAILGEALERVAEAANAR